MQDGFSVTTVEIEGFKGFASPKTINFGNRHVFLLGRNGNGKSSIVEAIRWGLFGSTNRSNDVIKNQHYPGGCSVTVKLVRNGEPWTLFRPLNLGTNRSGVPILTDRHGDRHPLREVMPQLDSVNTGEGTHIIFAPQSAPLRRQPEDLDPFERNVLRYLGLTQPRVLLDNLKDFLNDQTSAEDELGQELTDTRKRIDSEIAQEQARRSHIVNAPPWGSGPAPSISASEQKARRLIEEITGRSLVDNLERSSLEALVDSAEESLGAKRTEGHGNLENDLESLAKARRGLEELRTIQGQAVDQESTVNGVRSQLETVNNGLTLDDLREKLADAKFRATTDSIKDRIVRDAIDLIGRNDSEDVPCPVCDWNHNRQVLELMLRSSAPNCDDAISSFVDELESQVQESEKLETLLKEQDIRLHSLIEDTVKARDRLKEEDKNKLSDTYEIDQLIDNYLSRETVVKIRLADQDAWLDSKQAELNRLKEENRFHRIQRRLNSLQADKGELDRVIDSYDSLVAFGQSVRTIKEAVDAHLSEQLAQDIPRVSEILSKAFSALTQHPWYDRLIIANSTLPNLQLRVASSQDLSGREDPTGALNGQAESALAVVPYFAFNQTDDTPTEVLMVMLDDPTRAMDTEHINILLERLRELGETVQLVVASQETERFEEMIPKVFPEGSYVIIEPTGWSPDHGPNLKIVNE